jgi:hypothetical protein
MNMMIVNWRTQLFQIIVPKKGDFVIDHDSLDWCTCPTPGVAALCEGDYFRTFDPNNGRIQGTTSYIFYVHETPEYLDSHDCYVIDCTEVATRIFG